MNDTLTDEERQFLEKVKQIAFEELEEIKRREFRENFLKYIKERTQYHKNNPGYVSRLLGRPTGEVDDKDYQMDVDTELSTINQNI